MPNLIQLAGAQATKQTRFAPIFVNRAFTGLFTQRNPLRDPSDTIREKFYGGRPDALLGGVNVELTNRLTLARRPGLSPFSTVTYPEAPDYFYSFQKIDGTIDVIVDTSAHVYLDNQNGTKTLILNKSAGAVQSQFQGIGSTLYIGDGIDLQKWNDFGTGVPGNNNGNTLNPSWNWGIVAPTTKPGVVITESGASAVLWQASTIFSTMGLLEDSNGNIQQLISVNALGTNTTQFGTTGNGQPAWSQTPGSTLTDNGITWTNMGPIVLWTPGTTYDNSTVGGTLLNPCAIYDPGTNSVYLQFNPGLSQGTSGAVRPHFTGVNGSFIFDASVKWGCVHPAYTTWVPSHVYAAYGNANPGNDVNAAIVEPINLPPSSTQQVFFHKSSGGTSGTGGVNPPWATTPGFLTTDNQLKWVCLGSATWQATHVYSAWQGQSTLVFSVINDGANLQVCTTSGTSASLLPGTSFVLSAAANAAGGNTIYTGTFSPTLIPGNPVTIAGFTTPANNGIFTVVSCTSTQLTVNNAAGVAESHAATAVFNAWGVRYGTTTVDGTATWTCVGNSLSWAANTIWYLPIPGFAPPSSSQPYGGAEVKDTNSNVEAVIESGLSGSTQPAWNPIGNTTTDNGITWFAVSAFSQNSLVWTKSLDYAYSYKARSTSDPFDTTPPPGVMNALGPPTGSASGGISTASPAFEILGGNTGAINTISGIGSTDPQVDTIVIWRSADGGGSDNMFFLTEIQNPAPIGGIAQPWSFQDFLPDTTLNPLLPAPIDGFNNPPPAGFLPDDYHFGRIWGHVGNTVWFTGGPDTLSGNGNETVPPTNNFVFPAEVTRSMATPTGLIVFTVEDTYIIAGGPILTTFFSQPLIKGTGILSFNALTMQGNTIFGFTSDRQLISIDPSAGESEIGFPIGDQLANFNPANVYVTAHISGSADKAIYVADGSTGWYRLNPNQAPDGGAVWSVKANIVGGCKAVLSTEVSPGVHNLLVGATTGGDEILKRDLTVWADNGSAYPSNFTMGALMLAQPGQLAEIGFITLDLNRVGTTPTVSFLLDEISGTFTQFFAFNVSDPPELWGVAGAPSSLFSNRYYFNSTMAGNAVPPPAWCRFMEIEVDYGSTDTVQNELLTLTVFGAHYQEK